MQELSRLICEKRTYSRDFATHIHHYGQLLFPLEGSMQIETHRQALQLKSEHCLFIPPGCSHTFRAIGRNEFLILDLPKHYLSENEHHRAGVLMDIDERWKSVRYLLLEELQDSNVSSETALTHLGHFIGHTLQQQSYRSIQYIHDHYARSITVEELARMEHYHPAYFPVWFRKVTGRSPSAYIHHIRLKEAKRMLKETDWPITVIGQEVGYAHPSSFTRMFARYEGMSPQTYRKIFQSGKKELG